MALITIKKIGRSAGCDYPTLSAWWVSEGLASGNLVAQDKIKIAELEPELFVSPSGFDMFIQSGIVTDDQRFFYIRAKQGYEFKGQFTNSTGIMPLFSGSMAITVPNTRLEHFVIYDAGPKNITVNSQFLPIPGGDTGNIFNGHALRVKNCTVDSVGVLHPNMNVSTWATGSYFRFSAIDSSGSTVQNCVVHEGFIRVRYSGNREYPLTRMDNYGIRHDYTSNVQNNTVDNLTVDFTPHKSGVFFSNVAIHETYNPLTNISGINFWVSVNNPGYAKGPDSIAPIYGRGSGIYAIKQTNLNNISPEDSIRYITNANAVQPTFNLYQTTGILPQYSGICRYPTARFNNNAALRRLNASTSAQSGGYTSFFVCKPRSSPYTEWLGGGMVDSIFGSGPYGWSLFARSSGIFVGGSYPLPPCTHLGIVKNTDNALYHLVSPSVQDIIPVGTAYWVPYSSGIVDGETCLLSCTVSIGDSGIVRVRTFFNGESAGETELAYDRSVDYRNAAKYFGSIGHVSIGCHYNALGDADRDPLFFSGDFCEWIWRTSPLSDDQRQDIEAYLCTKWDIRPASYITHFPTGYWDTLYSGATGLLGSDLDRPVWFHNRKIPINTSYGKVINNACTNITTPYFNERPFYNFISQEPRNYTDFFDTITNPYEREVYPKIGCFGADAIRCSGDYNVSRTNFGLNDLPLIYNEDVSFIGVTGLFPATPTFTLENDYFIAKYTQNFLSGVYDSVNYIANSGGLYSNIIPESNLRIPPYNIGSRYDGNNTRNFINPLGFHNAGTPVSTFSWDVEGQPRFSPIPNNIGQVYLWSAGADQAGYGADNPYLGLALAMSGSPNAIGVTGVMPLYIYNTVPIYETSITLFTSGAYATASSGLDLYLSAYPYSPASGGLNLVIPPSIATAEFPLVIPGVEGWAPITSSINLTIEGRNTIYDSSGNISLYTLHSVPSSGFTTLVIPNVVSSAASRSAPLFVQGANQSLGNALTLVIPSSGNVGYVPLYIKGRGYFDEDSSLDGSTPYAVGIPLYISRYTEPQSNSIPFYLRCALGAPSGALNLTLTSAIPVNTGLNMSIPSTTSPVSNTTKLYTHGY